MTTSQVELLERIATHLEYGADHGNVVKDCDLLLAMLQAVIKDDRPSAIRCMDCDHTIGAHTDSDFEVGLCNARHCDCEKFSLSTEVKS